MCATDSWSAAINVGLIAPSVVSSSSSKLFLLDADYISSVATNQVHNSVFRIIQLMNDFLGID